MIEKKLLEILEPLVEEIVKVEKRVDALAREPGPAGKDGADGKDGVAPTAGDVAAEIKADGDFCERLRGLPGEAGRDGADGKDADPEAISERLKADPTFAASLKGEQGPQGEKGDPGDAGAAGRDGADADPEAVAAALKADEAFLAAVKGEQGLQGEKGYRGDNGDKGADADPIEVAKALMSSDDFVKSVTQLVEADPWAAGIYREGKCVSHYNGRLYKAVCDTTDEPGDSPHWKRLGTQGQRDVGGYDEKRAWEPGDLYHKDGSTFYFDGVNHRLQVAKPFTERDFDKQMKGLKASYTETLKAVIESNRELRALADGQQAEIETLKQLISDLSEMIKKVTK